MNFPDEGITQLPLTSRDSSTIQNAFECASQAMDSLDADHGSIPHLIHPEHDSYSCTGYHPLGGSLSSKYNKYREGFVFSNGELFDLEDHGVNFKSSMQDTRSILHSLAMLAVADIEAKFGLEPGYIQRIYGLGASLEHFSQWHLKRYSSTISSEDDNLALGVHTDPSILSVVVHDAPDVQPGGWGLQYSRKTKGPPVESKNPAPTAIEWKEVPYHGHGIATVMIGAAFARIMQVGTNTKNNERVVEMRKLFPPVRHRVVLQQGQNMETRRRMTLTYFLRPSPSSILEPLPPFMEHMVEAPKKQMSFGSWYKRVASRYNKKEQEGDGTTVRQPGTEY
eukprot:scaffold25535_cov117-Cylindrotheca_fusiformis.AAC.3